MRIRKFPVFLAFLTMGFGDAVGPFVSLAKDQFHLTATLASLVAFVGFGLYGVLSIPVGIVQDRKGKKPLLLFGLLVALAGVLSASFGLTSFPRFLLTVVLLGAGATILQVACNPIMQDVSDPEDFPRNLVLGQFIKAIGSLAGPMVPVIAAHYFGVSWQIIFPIFALFLSVTLVSVVLLPVRRDPLKQHSATLGSCLALLEDGYMRWMTGAIFLYVGSEVCVSAGIPLLLKEQFNVDIAKVGLLGTGLFFVALIMGRFLGSVILNCVSPSRFLILCCVAALVGLSCMFVPTRTFAVIGFFVTGISFANIFPLIFSAALERMPERTNEISGLLVTGIVGGALLPPLMGWMADHSSVRIGFLVPLAAILYVSTAALLNRTRVEIQPTVRA
jgi:FHS family L-fucose permease-like MFS transporter